MEAVNSKTIDIRGLSTEIKPKHWPLNEDGTENENNPMLGNGSTFFAMDTSQVFVFSTDMNDWFEVY